ncbi:trypco2 family protein [Streptomyces sp. NPDC001262]|uniref:trypco2 family protein n=1 Tax=unclassified Streptomyces TaxID=2593676 RepID=UPI00367D26C8
MPEELELAAAVRLLRDELLTASATASHEDLRFEVGPIGMEFTVELRRDMSAKAGFKTWVVSGDAEAKAGRTRTHKVSLTLTPKRSDGSSVEISQDAPDDDAGTEVLFTPLDPS